MHLFFFSNTCFLKIIVFDLQTAFFVGKTVFFRFLAEIRLRTPLKSPQKQNSRPICIKAMFLYQSYVFELLHAKPCRIISAFHEKVSFGGSPNFSVTNVSQKSSFLASRQRFLMEKLVLQVCGRNTFKNAYCGAVRKTPLWSP